MDPNCGHVAVLQWDLIQLMQELCREIIKVVPRNGTSICVHELCERYLAINLDFLSARLHPTVTIVLTVLYTVIIVLAMIGNICVILVFIKHRIARTSANMFIVSLSVSDLMITMFCMPINLSFVRNLGWHLGDFACRFVPFVQNIAVQSNSHTLVLIALDRFVAILHPMKIHVIHSGLAAVCCVWVVAILVSIPNWFFFRIIKLDQVIDVPKYIPNRFCMISEERRPFLEIYRWCMLVILFIIPLLVMVVCYIRIGHRLWSRGVIGAPIGYMDEARKRIRKRAVMMLILVVALFFCSWVPTWTFEMVALRTNMRATTINLAIRCFLVWLAMSNSAHNPIVYTFLHDKFRKVFLPAFKCCKTRVVPIKSATVDKSSSLSPNVKTEENTVQSNEEKGKSRQDTYQARY